MANPPGSNEIQYKDFIVADCGRAVTLRFALKGSNNTATFSDSFITAISRPTCTECYPATVCSDNHAIRLLTITKGGEQLPDKSGTSFDVVCNEESFDGKTFIKNVIFENFNLQYNEPALSACGNNVLFIPHSGGHSMISSTNTFKSKCNNCSIGAFGKFPKPSSSKLGWKGGCGDMFCTGRNNYLIEDHDGDLMGSPGTLVANNSAIGDGLGCTFYDFMNGHHC